MAKGKFAVGAIVGAAAGIVAGILTAPKSGKQTRGDIKSRAEELKKKGTSELKKAEKEVNIIKGDVEKVVKDVKTGAKKTVKDVKGSTKKTATSAKTAVKKTVKK